MEHRVSASPLAHDAGSDDGLLDSPGGSCRVDPRPRWWGGAGLLVAGLVIWWLTGIPTAHAAAGWRSIGPEGGTVLSILIDPTAPSTLYAGTNGGGVFKSTDGGAHWSAVNTGLTYPYPSALALDPTTPGTLYAGDRKSVV